MTPGIKKIIFLSMLLMVSVIGLLHYFTPGHYILFHDTFRRLAYFPISIGAILYGLPGGILMAFLACLSFVPHLLVFWYQGPEAYYSELSEILFYLAAGLVIGFISSRENRLRERYRLLSEKLSASYQRLHDQAARLVEAERQLGQARKMSLLGHLSASLAHEIKNPLASIKGVAEILADEVPETHPKHEFVDIMRTEISRLNGSVEEVLAYCRGQQGNGGGPDAAVSEIVEKVGRLLENQIREKSIRLHWEDRDGAGDVRVEEAGMIQVVMNLLLNAVDAVGENGIIRIRGTRDGEGVCLEVADNGPGIEADLLGEIFDAFVTFKDGGTGLGLSISATIVQRLGGTVTTGDSDLGGAAFTIRIPDKKGLE